MGTIEECLAAAEIEALELVKSAIEEMKQEEPTPPGFEEESKKKGWVKDRYGVMSRKKLSDMTPIERIDQRMKGMSWEEAEDVGVEILARCLSLHVHVRKDGEEYIDNLIKRIFDRAIKWTEEHSYTLAMARVGLKLKTTKEDS